MKTIHFHVGSGRCGSTLIQALFNEPTIHEVFARSSIMYDPQIYLALAKMTPLTEFDESAWKPLRDAHFAPMRDLPFDNFFVTQENLFGTNADKGSHNTCEATCDAISYLTEGFDTKIVILVRRQDTYFESLYNMQIKRWEQRDFSTFLDDVPLKNFDWAAIADVYAGRFGRDNVTVLPFEKAVLKSGGFDDFVAAVLATIGVQQKVRLTNVPTVNPSLAPRAVEVQRVANKVLSQREAHLLASWFEQAIPKSPHSDHSLISDAERKRVLAYFRDANERLCREYLQPFDAGYYLG